MESASCHLQYSNTYDCAAYGVPSRMWNGHQWRSHWLASTSTAGPDETALYLGEIPNELFVRKYGSTRIQKRGRNNSLTVSICDEIDADVSIRCNYLNMERFEISRPDTVKGKFDAIYCENIPAYLPADLRAEFLSTIRKLLTAKGRLCMTIPYPVGFSDRAEQGIALSEARIFSHPFYAVDVKNLLATLDCPAPYNSDVFPGFGAFNDDFIRSANGLILDRLSEIKTCPAQLSSISVIQIGIAVCFNN